MRRDRFGGRQGNECERPTRQGFRQVKTKTSVPKQGSAVDQNCETMDAGAGWSFRPGAVPFARVERVSKRVWLVVEDDRFNEHPFMYIVVGEERVVLVDTGVGTGCYADWVRGWIAKELGPAAAFLRLLVINTHCHFDHVGGNAALEQYVEAIAASSHDRAFTMALLDPARDTSLAEKVENRTLCFALLLLHIRCSDQDKPVLRRVVVVHRHTGRLHRASTLQGDALAARRRAHTDRRGRLPDHPPHARAYARLLVRLAGLRPRSHVWRYRLSVQPCARLGPELHSVSRPQFALRVASEPISLTAARLALLPSNLLADHRRQPRQRPCHVRTVDRAHALAAHGTRKQRHSRRGSHADGRVWAHLR